MHDLRLYRGLIHQQPENHRSKSWNNFAPFAAYLLRGCEFQTAQDALEGGAKLTQKEAPPKRGS
jgi:hypothetical protein